VFMSVWGGQNFVTEAVMNVEEVAPGVGRIICPECNGEPRAYAARFGSLRPQLAPNGCVDCKNRGWVYVSV
jgi:hypothetical protein